MNTTPKKVNLEKVKLGGTEKLELIGSLSTMVAAGISIFEVARSLREDAKGAQAIILEELLEDLAQGKHVYVTLGKFPRVFDRVTVNVIRASEEAGTLDVALRNLRATLQKDMEFWDKIRSALMYPTFIFITFFGILSLILVFVVPKIATVFLNMQVKLPLPTKIMIFLSDLIIKNTLWVGLGLLILAGGFYYLFTHERKRILEIFYRLPLVSGLISQIDVTNFARNLSILLRSGLPITQALELVIDVVVRRQTAELLTDGRKIVLSGRPLSQAFKNTSGLIPSIVVKLIEAGEKTGTLDKSLSEIAEYFDYKVSYTLKTLTALLEPVMLVMVGLVVGGMMLAIIAPIYGLIAQVGGR